MKSLMSVVALGAILPGLIAFGEEPDEFIDYIQPDGSQYFDTGVIGKVNTKVEIDFMQFDTPSEHGVCHFGCKGDGGKVFAPWYQNYNWGMHYDGKLVNKVTRANFEHRKMLVTIEKGKQTVEWNGTVYSPSSVSSTDLNTGLSMYLFAMNDNGSAVLASKPCRLYSLKVWQKETADGEYELVRDYRPCRKNGSVGLYDAVEETVIGPLNATGSATTIGPAVLTVKSTTQGGKTPVEQLVDAFKNASRGDFIRIEPGTYEFDDATYMGTVGSDKNRLVLSKPGVTVEGVTATPRQTWTYGFEPTVIKVPGGRCLYVNAGAACVRNLTFTGGVLTGSNWGAAVCQNGALNGVLSNCVFRGNSAARVGAVYQIRCVDCLFRENTADNCSGYRGDASETTGAWSCDFVGNTSTSDGSGSAVAEYCTLNDCLIAGNTGAIGINNNKLVSNCVFRSNTITAGTLVSGGLKLDCLFETNTVRYGCVTSGFTTNCIFRGNTAWHATSGASSGVAYNEFSVHHCRIYDNSAKTYGGAIYVGSGLATTCRVSDCVISNCTAQSGGAMAVEVTYPNSAGTTFSPGRLIVEDTTIVDCKAGSADVTGDGGILYTSFTINAGGEVDGDLRTFSVFTNCTLRHNSSTTWRGGITTATAKDCRFYDNRKEQTGHNYNGGDADNSILIGCELTGGDLNNCVVDHCYIHDVTNCYVFKNFCHVTNTLVEGCVPSTGQITYRNFNDRTYAPSDYVNCTFVKNTGWFYTGFATNVTSVNCAYFSNTNGNGTASAISWGTAKVTDSSHNIAVTFTNCCFGALSNVGEIYGTGNRTGVENPRFNAGQDPKRPYYEPRRSSALSGAGTNSIGFTDDDVDLAGAPRLRDGEVDIGCYQCWFDPIGLILMVR